MNSEENLKAVNLDSDMNLQFRRNSDMNLLFRRKTMSLFFFEEKGFIEPEWWRHAFDVEELDNNSVVICTILISYNCYIFNVNTTFSYNNGSTPDPSIILTYFVDKDELRIMSNDNKTPLKVNGSAFSCKLWQIIRMMNKCKYVKWKCSSIPLILAQDWIKSGLEEIIYRQRFPGKCVGAKYGF